MTRSMKCDGAKPPSRAWRSRGARSLGLAALVAAISSAAPEARAADDPAAAEVLFKKGRALVEAGDWAAGCPKFEASLALNPSASTMLNIARCHEHEGKLASAWADYTRALTLNNNETRGEERRRKLEAVAREGIAALEPRLPKLRVHIAPAPTGLAVTLDDKELPIPALDEPLPVNPGAHTIRATAPGYRTEERPMTAQEGKSETIELALTKGPGEASGGAGTPVGDQAAPVPTWVWAAGGGGVLLAGAAVFFLVDEAGAIAALDKNCPTTDKGTHCADGYDYQSDNARKNRDLGLGVALGVGAVAALSLSAYGLYRAKSSPKSSTSAPVNAAAFATPGGAGALIWGSF